MSAFEELLGQLGALAAQLAMPQQHLSLIMSEAAPAGIQEASQTIQALAGNVPFPHGHPSYEAIAGALMEAGGAIDAIMDAWNQVIEKARDAQAAIVHVNDEIEVAQYRLLGQS